MPALVPESPAARSIEKDKFGHEKPQKVHSEALGCVQVRGAAGLSMDLQQTQVYEPEESRPEKRETENTFVPPGDQGDNCQYPDGNRNFIHVDFLSVLARRIISKI